MRSFLVISEEREFFHAVQRKFAQDCRMEEVHSREAALDKLQKKRYDFVFIDITILHRLAEGCNGYREALQPFWHLYPAIEIVVLSPQDMIREAVRAVKAGVSDYI